MSKNIIQSPENSELGIKSGYDEAYNPSRLFPIPRAIKREEIGIDPNNLPFFGFDFWNHYEVSWLNSKGKPMVAMAEILYDCTSPLIIESKSLKLYFNSFNNTQIESTAHLEQVITEDLENALKTRVYVDIKALDTKCPSINSNFQGENIDEQDISCTQYTVESGFLETENQYVEEVLFSDLLKSNCLVTHQPDWGSVQISYKGKKINRKGLLRYIVSFRNHNEFHEQCIERIYIDIMRYCKPDILTVYGRYTRRGGLDINPLRSSEKLSPENLNQRLIRQ